MSISKIMVALTAAFFAAAGLMSVIWGVAVWLSTWLEPVAVPFTLADILAFVALVLCLVAKAMRPSVGLPLGASGHAAASFSAAPTPEEIQSLAGICARSPWTGLGASFVLGLVQGLDAPSRRK